MDLTSSLLGELPWLSVLAAVVVATMVAYGTYFISRAVLRPHMANDSEAMAGQMITRLGTLHALILALIFAQEMADYRDIFRIVAKEASAIADVHGALQEFSEDNPERLKPIRDQLVHYVQILLQVERKALARNQPSTLSRIEYRRINRALQDLQPMDSNQEEIRAQMLRDWDIVSDLHQRLKASVELTFPNFFWVVIVSGFIAIVVPCHVYSPTTSNLVMLGTFAALNGLVMYVIYAIGNPFLEPVSIDSTVLENLLTMMGESPR